MPLSATDIDRKLCLTAALLGARTRKDLAAAFRRANPRTSFDVERANKWLQGRARPREQQLYDDWSVVLGVGRSGAWIADCELKEFVEVLCRTRGEDREMLLRRAQAFGGDAQRPEAAGRDPPLVDLVGDYVCYSHAWSPYFQGRLIRGELTVGRGRTGGELVAAYAEMLPNGRMRAEGAVSVLRQVLHMDLRDSDGRTAFLFLLFLPTPPVSVLGGLMSGSTILGPEPQPSVTRIAIVRLPSPQPLLASTDAYLAPDASVAADLATFGVAVGDAAAADRLFAGFLARSASTGSDRAPLADYRALVEFFDRAWFVQARAAG